LSAPPVVVDLVADAAAKVAVPVLTVPLLAEVGDTTVEPLLAAALAGSSEADLVEVASVDDWGLMVVDTDVGATVDVATEDELAAAEDAAVARTDEKPDEVLAARKFPLWSTWMLCQLPLRSP